MVEKQILTNYFQAYIYPDKMRYLYGLFLNELKVTKVKTTKCNVKRH